MNVLEIIKNYETDKLFEKILCQKPQIIASVLACMDPRESCKLLSKLTNKVQIEVIENIAKISVISPHELLEIEKLLIGKDPENVYENGLAVRGVETAVEILNLTNRVTEKKIFAGLRYKNPDLLEIFQKRMFVFEDIVMLNDNDRKKVLSLADDNDLMKALKSVGSGIQKMVFRFVSEDRAKLIKDGMEYMGHVKLSEVKEAQWKIFKLMEPHFTDYEL